MKLVKEYIDFKRGLTSKEIKRQISGWKPGQILIVHLNERVPAKMFVFKEKKENSFQGIRGIYDDWNIHCLEVGYIAGTPKYAYFHFGPYEDIVIKREAHLEEPTIEEVNAIRKVFNTGKYQKYINKAEELVGAKLFVTT